MSKEMPQIVRNRLSKYFRILRRFRERGISRVQSDQIAEELRFDEEIDASTIRRDLAYLGSNGRQGFGYDVSNLINILAQEIGFGHQEEIVLIGAGHMGTALIKYNNFTNKIGQITCAFDLNEEEKEIEGVPVYHIRDLGLKFKSSYRIAIIAIPSAPAQKIAERLVSLGIRVIINYSDDNIIIRSKKVKVKNIDLNFFIQEAIYSLGLKGY